MANDPSAGRNKGKVETRKMGGFPQGYPFYGYYLGAATPFADEDELCANDQCLFLTPDHSGYQDE